MLKAWEPAAHSVNGLPIEVAKRAGQLGGKDQIRLGRAIVVFFGLAGA